MAVRMVRAATARRARCARRRRGRGTEKPREWISRDGAMVVVNCIPISRSGAHARLLSSSSSSLGPKYNEWTDKTEIALPSSSSSKSEGGSSCSSSDS